jgi:hypothetical protein
LATALAALGASQVASAGSTLVLDLGTYQSGDGGEFTATNSLPGGFGLQGYSAWTSTGGTFATSFDTFCVQNTPDDEQFTPGDTYNYSYSGQILGGPKDPKTLNQGVAWLYSQFASGHLVGYDYDNAGGMRTTDAAILQNEIWFLLGDGGVDNATYDTMITNAHLSGTYTAGEFGVDVLNLTTLNGGPAQDQLAYNNGGFNQHGHPIPDNGLTIALIGVSFLGLALFRRRSVKA